MLNRNVNRRHLLGLTLGAASAALMAACGAPAAPAATSAPAKPTEAPKPAEPTKPAAATSAPAPATAAPTQAPATKPTVATAPAPNTAQTGEFVFAAQNEFEANKPFLEEFLAQRYPNLKLRFELTPGVENLMTKFQTQLAAKETIDLVMLNEWWIVPLAKKGAFKPLDDFKKAQPFFVPETELYQSPYLWQGKHYELASGLVTMGLYYNEKLFTDAGVSYPANDTWTWDQWSEMVVKLTKDTNGDGKTDLFGFAPFSLRSIYSWAPILWAFGGSHFNTDGTKATLNEPGGVATLDFLQKLYRAKATPRDAEVEKLGGFYAPFMTGVAAMTQVNSGYHYNMYKATKGKFEWQIARWPTGPSGRFTVDIGVGLGIPATARLADVAWDWMRTMVSDLAWVERIAKAGGYVAHYDSMAKFMPPTGELSDVATNWTKVFVDDVKNHGKAINYSYIGAAYQTMLGAELNALADGSKTPKQAADAVVANATQILEENK